MSHEQQGSQLFILRNGECVPSYRPNCSTYFGPEPSACCILDIRNNRTINDHISYLYSVVGKHTFRCTHDPFSTNKKNIEHSVICRIHHLFKCLG